ncbi:MAG: galactokinase [Chitinophagaceae bacterium]|nr:galactokinase [Chitinophagaceae bacterium]
MKEKMAIEFRNRFQKEPEHIFFCPGRVNLIGEHIDYNGGKVMPCAISLGTYLAVSRNIEKRFRFQSLNFPEKADLHLQTSYSKSGKDWFNYPLGIINEFFQEGHGLSGLDMLFFGDLPVGAGLSSSASIEVLTAYALSEIFHIKISRKDIAILSKKSENEFMGVNCGIMDPFAVAMGQKNKAILLDCDSLAYEYLPLETGDYVLAIINSNKKRTLADSKYNERFAECGSVLKLLKQKIDVQNLCEVDITDFVQNKNWINDPVLEKRALHVITENARVKDALVALKKGDLVWFGKLLYASHKSLKEQYEVSGKELDTIVDFCKTYPGCIGARMTGAGFGGCAIALVKKISFDDFASKLILYYKNLIGYEAAVFAATTGDGVTEI